MNKQDIENLNFESLMKIKPNNTRQKLLWERQTNKHLCREIDKLNSELKSKNTALEQELKFYKELYTEGYFKGVNLESENSEKIKLQKKELNRLSQKMFSLNQENELLKLKYSNLKKAISINIEGFIMELEKVLSEGSRFINPVESFFKRLNEYINN